MNEPKTREQMIQELEEKVNNGELEFMSEIATPGIKTPVTTTGKD